MLTHDSKDLDHNMIFFWLVLYPLSIVVSGFNWIVLHIIKPVLGKLGMKFPQPLENLYDDTLPWDDE